MRYAGPIRRCSVALLVIGLGVTSQPGRAQSPATSVAFSTERSFVVIPDESEGAGAVERDAFGLTFDSRSTPILDTESVVHPAGIDGDGWRIVIYLDPAVATPSGIRQAVAELSRQATTLSRLGTVEIVVADPFAEVWLDPSRDASEISAAIDEMDELADGAGELMALRQELIEAKNDGESELEALVAGWSEELEILEDSRMEMARWLSQERPVGATCLILIQDGFDLGARFSESLAIDTASSYRRLLDRNTRNQAQLATTLAVAGWTVVPLALGQPWTQLLPGRTEVLTAMADLSGGELVEEASELTELLERLGRALEVRVRLEGAPDGLPKPLRLDVAGASMAYRTVRLATLGTPVTVSELRAIQTLEEPDLAVGPWSTTAILRPDPAGASTSGGFAGIVETLTELEGATADAAVFRVSLMLVELDGAPQIAHFLAPAGDLSGYGAWLYRQRLTVSENLAAGAVVVEELRSGRWGSAPLELADEPISTQGLEVAVWEAPTAPRPDRAGTTRPGPQDKEQVVIRILPPKKRPAVGKIRFQTLVSSPIVERVEFLLDGESAASDTRAPFSASIDLGQEVAMHSVEAVAFAANDAQLGSHRIVINPRDDSFQVRITELSGAQGATQTVNAEVRVPADAELDRVEFYWNETLVETQTHAPFSIDLPLPDPGSQAFVRVAAYLTDGSWIDDAQLLGEGAISERVEVNLVELHVVVTDRSGKPVEGLTEDDFTVRLGREEMQIQRLGFAEEVPLTLGVVIDTSESMWPLMVDTQQAGAQFVANTLIEGDRAFLVDFDTQPRLAQDTTSDIMQLLRTFSRFQADGFTALYDAVIFSMLQFEETGGRKALVLLTDGDDYKSRYGPRRCIEYGKRLGVPVYIISLAGVHDSRRNLRRIDLEGITEGTGGQVFYIEQMQELEEAYARINRELRSQYILTFATERELSELELEEIDVSVADRSLELRGVVGGQRLE